MKRVVGIAYEEHPSSRRQNCPDVIDFPTKHDSCDPSRHISDPELERAQVVGGDCVAAICANGLRDFRVVVVDNGGNLPAAMLLPPHVPAVRCPKLDPRRRRSLAFGHVQPPRISLRIPSSAFGGASTSASPAAISSPECRVRRSRAISKRTTASASTRWDRSIPSRVGRPPGPATRALGAARCKHQL
jgi:hypothetical protein